MADTRLTLPAGTGPALHTATVVLPVVDLTARPTANTTPECQLLFGDHVRVHAIKSGWAFGVALNALDGRRRDYVGWVRAKALLATRIVPTHRVHVLQAPVFARPDIKSPVRQFLPLNSRIRSTGSRDGFEQMGGGGFVHAQHLLALGREEGAFAQDFVDTAEAFQGLPYVWGGNGPDGMDCSGLVKLSLQSAGVPCPRDADQQEDKLGRAHRPDSALMNLRRGDLVFWPGHVGVMQTSGRLLHANAHHMRVATEPLADAVERIGAIRTVKRL